MKEIAFRPTIVIGLGGTGYSVLLKLKKRLKNALGEVPPCITFLSIDTTEPEDAFNLADDGSLVKLDLGVERYIIQLANTKGYVEDVNSHVASWWPKDLQPTAVNSGATQIRAKGRLSLFADFVEIRRRLREKLDYVTDIRTAQQMDERSFRPSERNGIEVYIVSSLAGGTGSGMLLDMSFITRNMLDESSNITGVMVMPRVFDKQTNSLVNANAYGALKEIEHFMKFRGQDRYVVDYGNEKIDVTRKPFDFLYLIDNVNGGNGGKGKTTINDVPTLCSFIAEGLFFQISSAIGTNNNNVLDNIKGAIDDAPRILGRSASYWSFGVGVLRARLELFKHAHEAQKVASAKNLVDALLTAADPAVDPAQRAAELRKKLGLDLDEGEMARGFILNKGSVAAVNFGISTQNRNQVVQEAMKSHESIKADREQLSNRVTTENYERRLAEGVKVLNGWWEETINRPGGFRAAEETILSLDASLLSTSERLGEELKRKRADFKRHSESELERYKKGLDEATEWKFIRLLKGHTGDIVAARDAFVSFVNTENKKFFDAEAFQAAQKFVDALRLHLAELQRSLADILKSLGEAKGMMKAGNVSKDTAATEDAEEFEHFLKYKPENDPEKVSPDDFFTVLGGEAISVSAFPKMESPEVVAKVMAIVSKRYGDFLPHSIEAVIREMSKGGQGAEQLAVDLRRLSDLADPLWSYDKSKIPLEQANETLNESNYCGTEHGDDSLLSKHMSEYLSPNRKSMSFVKTEDPHRVFLFKVEVGVPLFALDGIAQMQRAYYKREQVVFNHIHKDWVKFADPIPPTKSHFYFSVSLVPQHFGILEVDANEQYFLNQGHVGNGSNGHQNGQRRLLGKGRLKAYEAFESDTKLLLDIAKRVQEVLDNNREQVRSILHEHIESLEKRVENGSANSPDSRLIRREIEAVQECINSL